MKKRLFTQPTDFKLLVMKLLLSSLLITISSCYKAQITPTILIDNQPIKIQGTTSLPYWIGAGKELTLAQDAVSASVLEFTINNSNLEFNQTLHITSTSTVPTGKIWKIEAIGIGNNLNYNSISNFSNSTIPTIFSSPVTFATAGTFTWTIPPGVTNICVEAWGGGGKGGNGYSGGNSGGGGGGGGYGYQCFTVSPGQQFTIIVGNSNQNSSFGSLITAYSGTNGGNGSLTNLGSIGIGGSSTANYSINGENGISTSSYCSTPASKGGNGGNGGVGGNGAYSVCVGGGSGGTSQAGAFPGGGGGGGTSSSISGANGASGQIKVYF
jgi:hypothetical protein